MSNILFPLLDSIFTGTLVLVICILSALVFKIKLQLIDLRTLIIAVNWVLLFGGTLFLVNILTRAFNAYYQGGEEEQYIFWNGLGIDNVFTLTVLWLFSHGLILQLLWFKKFRQSIFIATTVVGIWAVHYFIEPIIAAHQSWRMIYPISLPDILFKAAVYIAILSAVYLLVVKRIRPKNSIAD